MPDRASEQQRCDGCGHPENECICGYEPEEEECSCCCGDGFERNPDPLRYGMSDYINCTACGGSGKRKDQTVF